MTLEQWVANDWLRLEPSSPREIRDLLSVVSRSLTDAKVEVISDDLRFQTAFNAALNSANIALRASGYRTRVQLGHHQKIVESLELTVQADAKTIRKLLVFSRKRNAISYDVAGSVTQQDLQQMIKVADELQKTVTDWLKVHHPELMKS
jgi:hypothetical protein